MNYKLTTVVYIHLNLNYTYIFLCPCHYIFLILTSLGENWNLKRPTAFLMCFNLLGIISSATNIGDIY